jgi:nucleotide-binding universal stress UspA family protein
MNTNDSTEGTEGEAGPALGVVVCGVDPSEPSRMVPRHALAVADEGAEVRAVSVWDPVLATDPEAELAPSDLELRKRCELALERASEINRDIKTSLLQGGVIPSLLGSAAGYSADLLAVASSGESRAAGVLFGRVATAMLREAPCSVLISRDSSSEFPGRILHAGDGSIDSLDAAWVAARIASRHGVPVSTISAGTGPDALSQSKRVFDSAGVEVDAVERDGSAHRELVSFAESEEVGLIVMGSKGRTGLASIGSVSERVAHGAPCPVLVIRPTSHPHVEH